MSVSRFPNPITTNFIPEAWDFTILNRFANFILTYPVAQGKVVFQTVTVGTATLLTQMANTAYVFANLVPYLATLTATTTWTGSNQFNSIKVNTLVNMTLNNPDFGTTTLTNSTFNNPFTPTYSYPIGTATGNNTPSIGTVGTIGFIPATTFITNTIGEGGGGGGVSVRRVTLTSGTWVLYGFIKFANGVSLPVSLGIMFSTALNNSTGFLSNKGTQRFPTVPSDACMGLNTLGFVTLTSTTTYFLNGRAVFGGGTILFSKIVAVRIA